MTIQKRLFELQDKKYADFQAKLVPNIAKETVIGVRVPALRQLAKALKKDLQKGEKEVDERNKDVWMFLKEAPHTYYDESILHAILLSEMKDFDCCIEMTEAFLPYVDNWAVCDSLSPKVFGRKKEELIEKIREWSSSSHAYTCRFGIEMLMKHFLEDAFKKEYLEIPAKVHSEEYYVNMMIAWFFATALAKQWEDTIVYLQENRLDEWVHNKTIQKARESNRITKEQKEYLKGLKRDSSVIF